MCKFMSRSRRLIYAGLMGSIIVLLGSCRSYKDTGLQITPDSATTGGAGSTVQFRALEISADTGHPSKTRDATNSVAWSSSDPGVATISDGGLATAVASGTTTITASTNGSFGILTATASLTAKGHDLITLAIAPGSQTLYSVGETAQFVAIGTFSTPPITQDMTNQVTWRSTDVNLATINSSGLATAVNCPGSQTCNTTITASAFSTTGSNVASLPSTLTLTLGGGGGSNLPSLTIYKVGLGTGTVTGVAGSGINCGNSCTANFVLNSNVVLTATPDAGSVFGGWSANCIQPTATTCTVSMQNSETVGAIFNQQ